MTITKTACLLTIAGLVWLTLSPTAAAGVLRQDDRTFIVDRTGERWEITRAVAMGFEPEGFQFGIGRHAIKPLDERHFRVDRHNTTGNLRVIGVKRDGESQAYAVSKLTRHEIANTVIAGDPIAAAY